MNIFRFFCFCLRNSLDDEELSFFYNKTKILKTGSR